MANIFDGKLNSILKNQVTPFLKELGFKKNLLIYSRDVGELKWLIDIQKSRWNDESEAQFTLNFGVYVPGVLSTYANMPEPAKPKIEHCSCSARVGMLTSERKDKWWKLTSDDSQEVVDEISQDLLSKIREIAVPFLSKFNSSLEVAEFLSSELSKEHSQISPQTNAQRLAFSGIIYSKLGDKTKASRVLDDAVEASIKSPIETVVRNVRGSL